MNNSLLLLLLLLFFLFPLLWLVWWRRCFINTAHFNPLEITTASTAFNKQKYSHIIHWDKHSLRIHGRPIYIVSGEFHYWRVPDVSRWHSILSTYKEAGLNTIRIYFHWGFHSPREGVYDFTAGTVRDIYYLMTLCRDLGLMVLAAPGPYICAETQGGGHPIWLLQKRHIRIRHSKGPLLVREYDPNYSFYCREWFAHLFRILAPHQITNSMDSANGGGCLIALQIENEMFENIFSVIPIGLRNDMAYLTKCARDLGITVPLFTNDGFEEGSFNPTTKEGDGRRGGRFGIDLYGFDKYVIFVPVSTIAANLGLGSSSTPHSSSTPSQSKLSSSLTKKRPPPIAWPEWSPATFKSAIDHMESKVRGFGGGAASSPLFIPELQGGWFNHYKCTHDYDDVYRFYGEAYTSTIVESALAQNVSMMSLYMFYGGTNWGTIGDPDVYTSYDYSACIRETGFLSGRGRLVRLAFGFARCFSPLLLHSLPVNITASNALFDSSSLGDKGDWLLEFNPPDVFNRARKSLLPQQQPYPSTSASTTFVFMRNFNGKVQSLASSGYTVKVKRRHRYRTNNGPNNSLIMTGQLPYKSSYILLMNHTVFGGGGGLLHLVFATTPVVFMMKGFHAGSTDRIDQVWFIRNEPSHRGQLLFRSTPTINNSSSVKINVISGTLGAVTENIVPPQHHELTLISFEASVGWAAVEMGRERLILVAVGQEDVYTLTPVFQSDLEIKKHRQEEEEVESSYFPRAVLWGANTNYLDLESGRVHIKASPGQLQKDVFCVTETCPVGFTSVSSSSSVAFHELPVSIWHRSLSTSPSTAITTTTSTVVENHPLIPRFSSPLLSRVMQFHKMDWIPLPFIPDNSKNTSHRRIIPTLDPLDLGYTSGHSLYKINFTLLGGGGRVLLRLNARHRTTIYLNNKAIGGHMTYSLQVLRAGSKIGPDLTSFGWREYVLDQGLLVLGKDEGGGQNELVILVESLGQNRQPFFFNDVRNKRGILGLEIKTKGSTRVENVWPSITGVNVLAPGYHVLSNFSSSGFPDESCLDMEVEWISNLATPNSTLSLPIPVDSRPIWYKTTFDALHDGLTFSMPLRLHVNGPGTAYIWLNDTIIARYYGTDGPQHDFYLMSGLLKTDEVNEIKMVVYNGRVDDGEDQGGILTVQIKGWNVTLNGPAEDRWSGNLDDNNNILLERILE